MKTETYEVVAERHCVGPNKVATFKRYTIRGAFKRFKTISRRPEYNWDMLQLWQIGALVQKRFIADFAQRGISQRRTFAYAKLDIELQGELTSH